jgi:hypothetical protein
MSLRPPALLIGGLALLAGCAGRNGEGGTGWPTLEPRTDERSVMVPRIASGACATCGPDRTGASAQRLAPPDLPPLAQPLPADLRDRLDAIDATLARLEQDWPAALERGRAAIARARPDRRETEAEVQASRYEALFQPLGREDAALAALEALLPDAPGGEAWTDEVAALRARADALAAARDRSLAP